MIGAVLALFGTVFTGVSNNILSTKNNDLAYQQQQAAQEQLAAQGQLMKFGLIGQEKQTEQIAIIAVVLMILFAFAYLAFKK